MKILPLRISSPSEFFSKISDSFLSFLYPSQCLHCSSRLEKWSDTFCQTCFSLLEILPGSHRCPRCFSTQYSPANGKCGNCKKYPSYFKRCAAAFEFIGPAASLVRALKYQNRAHLAKGCAAYMAYQFLKLGWPVPDLIVPVPITPFKRWSRGYNQSFLIGQALGKILDCPAKEILKRRNGNNFSQAVLSKHLRSRLSKDSFYLKRNASIEDLTLLIIDDVMTTQTTLRRCAEALFEGCPKCLYTLTLCMTPE